MSIKGRVDKLEQILAKENVNENDIDFSIFTIEDLEAIVNSESEEEVLSIVNKYVNAAKK